MTDMAESWDVEGQQLHTKVLLEHGYEFVQALGKGGYSSVFLVK